MKITEISIKNFRSFDERGVSIVVGEVAAFVGKNSSGTVSYTHLTLPTIA